MLYELGQCTAARNAHDAGQGDARELTVFCQVSDQEKFHIM